MNILLNIWNFLKEKFSKLGDSVKSLFQSKIVNIINKIIDSVLKQMSSDKFSDNTYDLIKKYSPALLNDESVKLTLKNVIKEIITIVKNKENSVINIDDNLLESVYIELISKLILKINNENEIKNSIKEYSVLIKDLIENNRDQIEDFVKQI